MWTAVTLVILSLPSVSFAQTFALTKKAKIIILLDDVGYRKSDLSAFALPVEVAFAILPQTPHATAYAEMANSQGRDVMLHLPMASASNKVLGPAALTVNMFREDIEYTLEEALQSVPHVIGVNNHMGSALTAEPASMRALMAAIKNRALFFIDSVTTPSTVAYKTALQMGVPADKRQVFLDHVQTPLFFKHQFSRLVAIAKKHGRAIGIAHPYPLTIELLTESLAELDPGVSLASVSEHFAAMSKPKRLVSHRLTTAPTDD